MSKSSWVCGMGAATALALAGLPVVAAPTLVDFEPGFVLLNNGETYSQAGFNFTAVGAGAVADPINCDPSSEFCAVGNSSSVLQALNDTEVDLTAALGRFSLGGFSAAFVPSPLVDLSGSLVRLRLDGINASGAAVNTSVALAEDGSSGNFLFGMYDASSLGVLRTLSFSVCFDDGSSCAASPFLNDAQFALDNLSLTAVPEPGAAWLVGLCLAGLALTRRRAA